MKFISRVLLIVYSFLSMIIWSMGFIITVFKLPYVKSVLYKTGEVLKIPFLQEPAVWLIVLFICVAWFMFSLYTFIIGVNGDREFKSIVKENSIGKIKISSATFEHISLNVIRKLGGIKDARAVIKIAGDEVRVTVHATFMSDVNIPVFSEEAQIRIVQSIEQCTGVKTPEVKIIVDGVHNAYKGRVD